MHIAAMIRGAIKFLVFAVPWVVKIVLFMARTVWLAVAAFWVGVPRGVERIATDWMGRVVAAGFTTEFDTPLYYLFKVIAYVMILAGWVLFAYLTVWITWKLFSGCGAC